LAIPLIIAAFKVRRLQRGWERAKEFRKDVFPLHFAGKKGPPAPEEGDTKIEWKVGRFYWGGPSPRRDDQPDDI
jgi:hypothetical protein